MKHVSEFRNPEVIKSLSKKINELNLDKDSLPKPEKSNIPAHQILYSLFRI